MTENDYGFNFQENAEALKNALEESKVEQAKEDALTGGAAAYEASLAAAEKQAKLVEEAAAEAQAAYEAQAANQAGPAASEEKVNTMWPETPVEPVWAEDAPESGRESAEQAAGSTEYFDRLDRPIPSAYDTENTDHTKQKKTKKTKAKKEKAPKKRGFFSRLLTAAVLGVLFGVCAGAGCYGVFQYTGVLEKLNTANEIAHTQPVLNETILEEKEPVVTDLMDVRVVNYDISDVAEEVMPSMVSIVNNYVTTGSFFGHLFEENNAASGSGIIVGQNDTELLLVTNHHVVKDATSLEVTFIDGEVANANIKGLDADMDLAVIAVPLSSISEETKGKISIATLGDSDILKLGEPVIAIGNALGYGQSVTNGIVSALNREMTLSDGSTGTFIQTNAAINPGNSGGALLNIRGEVIGINSNKIGGSTVEGMGYAIPISAANPIISELQSRQTRTEAVAEAKRGYLGVSLQEITAEISQFYNMPVGAFIYSIEEGSAAEKAGLMKNDIIVKIEGEKVASAQDLRDVLQYFAVGDEVKLTVMRVESGEYVEHEIPVTLGKRPAGN